jgi:hypothetical protein
VKQRTGLAETTAGYEMEKKELLVEYGLKKMSIVTIYHWMVCLGVKYQVRKKVGMSTGMKSLQH